MEILLGSYGFALWAGNSRLEVVRKVQIWADPARVLECFSANRCEILGDVGWIDGRSWLCSGGLADVGHCQWNESGSSVVEVRLMGTGPAPTFLVIGLPAVADVGLQALRHLNATAPDGNCFDPGRRCRPIFERVAEEVPPVLQAARRDRSEAAAKGWGDLCVSTAGPVSASEAAVCLLAPL